jgi:sigma-B regulation protein RsbU (phosphoserine phosphatase)
MNEAHDIQQRLLPVGLPRIRGCTIEASWQPAGNVGGDYFDAIELNDHALAFCIADVSGKGLPAALLMSNVQAMVRAYAGLSRSPSEMCRRLNRTICDNTLSGRFVTLFYGVLDTKERVLRYTNAGHIPPIVVRRHGGTEKLSEGGMVLGLFPESRYDESEVLLHSGDCLALLTDGITEASNAEGAMFGEDDRIVGLLLEHRHKGSGELKQVLLDSVASFTKGELQDDATLMVVSMQ